MNARIKTHASMANALIQMGASIVHVKKGTQNLIILALKRIKAVDQRYLSSFTFL